MISFLNGRKYRWKENEVNKKDEFKLNLEIKLGKREVQFMIT
jgi:hypothetical protein